MSELERRAGLLKSDSALDDLIDFFTGVACLKQPHRIERSEIAAALRSAPECLRSAAVALSEIDSLDYRVMDSLATVPFFGRRGGRSFASAVVRLFRPAEFGIIDWRNLAVLTAAGEFSGLIEPPMALRSLSSEDILALKGHLLLDQSTYVEYNELLRALGRECLLPVADIDLALWTYSIERRPFKAPSQSVFERFFAIGAADRGKLKSSGRSEFIRSQTGRYLDALADIGYLFRARVLSELRSLFKLVRGECSAWGQHHRYAILQVLHVTRALDEALEGRSDTYLLQKWRRWEGMVDTTRSSYRGISLPASMIVDGYFVFEDFVRIREYFERFYQDGTFEPIEHPR